MHSDAAAATAAEIAEEEEKPCKYVTVRRSGLPVLASNRDKIWSLFGVRLLLDNETVANDGRDVAVPIEHDGSLNNGIVARVQQYVDSACCAGTDRHLCQIRSHSRDVFERLLRKRDMVERTSCAALSIRSSDAIVEVTGLSECVATAVTMLVEGEEGGDVSVVTIPPQTQTDSAAVAAAVQESEDSSYDSDYDGGGGHDDVSRTVSDTLGAEFAEYVTQPPSSTQQYHNRVQFALKLGYTERLVQSALAKLGPTPGQNELLAELIRLGNSSSVSPTPTSTSGLPSEYTENAESDVATLPPHIDDDDTASQLRHIVIDGSNVAMSHGNKEAFSCRGIKICVDWFKERGHTDITVFVPSWRKEASRPLTPIKDQEILLELERERLLVFTPSRLVGGKRLVCYDDRYVLKLAAQTNGIVVSNDNYRDLAGENPEFKRVVDERILMYSFVNDRFMPPDDPLGRKGPDLRTFLRKQPFFTPEQLPPSCPYGRKCTYGNKCKYYHPERGTKPQKSVTERLAENAHRQLQEVKARGYHSRDSSPGEHLKGAKSLSLPLPSSEKIVSRKMPLTRTESGAPSVSMRRQPAPQHQPHIPVGLSHSLSPTSGEGSSAQVHGSVTKSKSVENVDLPAPHSSTWTLLPPLQQQWAQFPVQAEQSPSLDGTNLHRKLRRQLTLNPSYDPRLYQTKGSVPAAVRKPQFCPTVRPQYGHQTLTRCASTRQVPSWELSVPDHAAASRHQNVTRIASAPDSYRQYAEASSPMSFHSLGVIRPPMQRTGSTSDPQLNLYGAQCFGGPQPWAGWSVPAGAYGAPSDRDEARKHIEFHLSSIFPEDRVKVAMSLYPDEVDPNVICAAVINMMPPQ